MKDTTRIASEGTRRMNARLTTLAALALALVLPLGAAAERVAGLDLGAGAVELTDRFTGHDGILYQFDTERGRRLKVTMTASNPATYFSIYPPGTGPGEAPMFNGAREGNRYEGTLPYKGVYSVHVYLFRSAAQRGQSTEYTLTIAPDGGTVAGGQGPNGQPAFWMVDVDGALKVNATPALDAALEGALNGGTIVRNLGCSVIDDISWCRIDSRGDGIAGWVIADYLSPAPGTAVRTGTVPYVAPGPTRTADGTGTMPCAASHDTPMTECRYAVFRDGEGSGTLQIERPGGELRHIQFVDGVADATDGGGEMQLSRQGNWLFISIGGEHYAVDLDTFAGG